MERVLILASAALGLAHAWIGRYSMNPDGISYLDMGDSFAHRDWANALNAYWSPLYGWTLGLAVSALRPSPRWEFPVVHLVNFGIFLIALLAFRFLLHAFLEFCHARTAKQAVANQTAALPDWAFVLLGYTLFLWASLELETIYDVSPDLAVLACVCLAAGLMLRLRQAPTFLGFALFGLVLGAGYWIKAPLFPLGFAFLLLAYLWKRSSREWRYGVIVASLVFVCASAPLVILLSIEKGRLTFGDSGKLNYVWFVSPRTFPKNWQGEVSGSGTPVHPTRQLLRNPAVFEFDGPVAGSYPPWTDPSYWNEGLRWHFNLRPQVQMLAVNFASELRLLLRAQPGLMAGLLALALISGRVWLAELRELWPFVTVPIAAMAMYLPIHVEDRFLGGFVLVLFLSALAAVRLRPADQRAAACVAVAVFVTMALGTIDLTVRYATNHLAIPGSGPSLALEDVIAAEQLAHMRAGPGDKIAVLGNGTGGYSAHLAKLRIIAEIAPVPHGPERFWRMPAEAKQQAYGVLAGAHAKFIMASCPEDIPGAWERVSGTTYCVLRLSEAR